MYSTKVRVESTWEESIRYLLEVPELSGDGACSSLTVFVSDIFRAFTRPIARRLQVCQLQLVYYLLREPPIREVIIEEILTPKKTLGKLLANILVSLSWSLSLVKIETFTAKWCLRRGTCLQVSTYRRNRPTRK